MATFKAKGQVSAFHEKMITGMLAKGYTQDFAERVFKQLEGFGSYGFPESHAASFALLVYISSWMKCFYPDIFAASLLNSQPMGFYQPAQIIGDARKHGVTVRPVDVNHSWWDHTLEEKEGKYHALRLGFRQVKGIREEDVQLLLAARSEGIQHISTLFDAGVSIATLELLADADAYRSLGLDRRQSLWHIAALSDHLTGLFSGLQQDTSVEQGIQLPLMSLPEHVVHDYRSTSVSLKAHPIEFVRPQLNRLKATRHSDLSHCTNGMQVKVAGLVLVRQRPSTANGICFITIEDETGSANLVVFANLFARYRKEIVSSRLLMIEGKVQKEGEVIHVVAQRCYDLTGLLGPLTQPEARASEDQSIDYMPSTSTGTEKTKKKTAASEAADAKALATSKDGPAFNSGAFYGGRNFR
jgi:error-prone DNA polymerase